MTQPAICILSALLCTIRTDACVIPSTNNNGTFQAIAQSPTRISLHIKGASGPVPILVDGRERCDLQFQFDEASGFGTCSIDGLPPNSTHTFRVTGLGEEITERTWNEVPGQAHFDLLIVGGTASGVSAAVSASRLGLSVALVEETNRLGGMASNGLGATDIRSLSRANGFFEDFRQRIREFYGGTDGRKYEPRVANAVIKSMVYEQQAVSLFLKCRADRPIMDGSRVTGAVVRDTTSGRTGVITAAVTIDATHTGDFAAACGCDYRVGREPRSEDEPHAGVLYFEDSTQTTLPGSTGEGDSKQQSYSYLMVWKDYGEAGAKLIDEPRSYDPETYRHSPRWERTWNRLSGALPNGKFEINQHPFGTDWPGINFDYPEADAVRRQEIEAMYRDRALGYLYYIQNELGHTNLGLADDEFVDSQNFPQTLYVREARRIMGEYLFKESDVINARSIHRADSIAVGDYPMDSHATEDLKDPSRRDKGEGECWLVSFTPWYQVPFGVLVPRNVDGLLVSTAVSATHIGYGTLRMEPVRMSLGQAAAAAAYWSILYSVEPRDVNPAWVQDKILSQYGYISWNSDVNRHTRHFKALNFVSARGLFINEKMAPHRALTREEALIVLNRLLALEGYDGQMEPAHSKTASEPITRGEFARLLVEAKQKTSDYWDWVEPKQPSYSDVPAQSEWYAAVETLKAHRINAMLFEYGESGKFKPDSPISRGDAAEAVYLAHRDYAMNFWRLRADPSGSTAVGGSR